MDEIQTGDTVNIPLPSGGEETAVVTKIDGGILSGKVLDGPNKGQFVAIDMRRFKAKQIAMN
jgi:hypothetical protein|tara:strand:+ start:126 stop:311 length:186 start_codon:yes stop_codon:yes gene_type:complete